MLFILYGSFVAEYCTTFMNIVSKQFCLNIT